MSASMAEAWTGCWVSEAMALRMAFRGALVSSLCLDLYYVVEYGQDGVCLVEGEISRDERQTVYTWWFPLVG